MSAVAELAVAELARVRETQPGSPKSGHFGYDEESLPPLIDIVLAGIGHTNAHVVWQWGCAPLPNVRLTCVSAFPTATYSGMLPGVLAGLYAPDQMRIDLRRLCDAVGARLIVGEVTQCDVTGRRLSLLDRSTVPYDLLSIGIGSQARPPTVGATAESLVPIKPMQTFLERLDARLALLRERPLGGADRAEPVRVAVVGGGAGGTEIALGLVPHLQRSLGDRPFAVQLFVADARVVSGLRARTSRILAEELQRRAVALNLDCRVSSVTPGGVRADDGREWPADLVVWATDAVAARWLRGTDLSTDERGFLLTRRTLQSVARDDLFAVGDAGTIVDDQLPKAGVYAVREGPILWENLRRSVVGQPLVDYRPQRSFLKLLSLGDGRAVGEYRGWTFRGGWVWRWKDRIDRQFMRRYQR